MSQLITFDLKPSDCVSSWSRVIAGPGLLEQVKRRQSAKENITSLVVDINKYFEFIIYI